MAEEEDNVLDAGRAVSGTTFWRGLNRVLPASWPHPQTDAACSSRSIRRRGPCLEGSWLRCRRSSSQPACRCGAGGCQFPPAAGTAAAAATPELSDDHPTGRPPRGRGRHPGLLDRLRGRPVLRQRLAHHRRDGRRVDAAAEAGRRRLVRARRPVGRPGDEVHQRLGLHPLRPADHRRPERGSAPTSCPTGGAARCSASRSPTPARPGPPSCPSTPTPS